MPCKWELILQSLLPIAGAGFDVYTVARDNVRYEKLTGPPSEACAASRVVLTPKAGLKPFETEAPIDALKSRIEAETDIEVLKFINRKGPFYGFYLEVRMRYDGI